MFRYLSNQMHSFNMNIPIFDKINEYALSRMEWNDYTGLVWTPWTPTSDVTHLSRHAMVKLFSF